MLTNWRILSFLDHWQHWRVGPLAAQALPPPRPDCPALGVPQPQHHLSQGGALSTCVAPCSDLTCHSVPALARLRDSVYTIVGRRLKLKGALTLSAKKVVSPYPLKKSPIK
jgi:hypothetical protein